MMWRCGNGFDETTKILLKVDLHTGEILINHLDEFWSQSDYVTSSKIPTWEQMEKAN
ncbi:MAG: hypothetical protein GX489_02150 [Firmicutes bacterium]|nr:hypothetical protein [Bacillota bacterium]